MSDDRWENFSNAMQEQIHAARGAMTSAAIKFRNSLQQEFAGCNMQQIKEALDATDRAIATVLDTSFPDEELDDDLKQLGMRHTFLTNIMNGLVCCPVRIEPSQPMHEGIHPSYAPLYI